MAHIMTNKKRHVKWHHVEPKVAKLARKVIPASWFRGIKEVDAVNYSDQAAFMDALMSYDDNEDVLSMTIPKTRQILLFRDRIKEYLKKEYNADYYKDKETRRIIELWLLAHEFYHNEQKLEGRFYSGLYKANPIYREKIEKEANGKAKKLLENFKG